MQVIKIGFSTRNDFNPLSKLIMLIEKAPYSHTYIKFPVKSEMVFQASGLLVNFESLSNFNLKEKIIKEFSFEVSDEIYNKILDFAEQSAGDSYGIAELIGMGIMKIFRLSKNPFPGGKTKFICVKLVATVAEIMGMETLENIEDMDLNDLYNLISNAK